uniref:Uncharacterized protein n=1 Tax=Gopherus agassizii TaxID=38772 RepID=A0A452H652_9SAUR
MDLKRLTKTGIALLYDEGSENAYDIQLKLTKEVLTVQKQDVICISGNVHSTNVSTSISILLPTIYVYVFPNRYSTK